MTKFRSGQFEVKTEAGEGASSEPRVVKLETVSKPTVETFRFSRIQKAGEGDYASVKAKFGALAATDTNRTSRSRKDARFTLNPLLRDPLSVEEEERRVIEEKVRARVQAITESAKAEAVKAGYQDGLKKGHEEAFRRFQQEGAERLARFEAFLTEVENAKDEIFRANERFIVEIAYRIARMIVLKEVATDKEYVLRLARELIERIGVRENISIRVHPDEIATAGMLKEGLEKAMGTLKNLNVEASNQVRRGGCMIETEWNAIDASIETQLQGIFAALVGGGSGSV